MAKRKAQRDEASDVGSELTGNGKDLWHVEEHVERPAEKVPVIHDVDVVVAGSGVAGIIAALAAARHGAKTMMIESLAYLGGNMGPGMFGGGSLHGALKNPEAFPDGLGGIPAEFNSRVVDGEDRNVGSDYFRDSQAVSYVTTRMLEEAGSEILLSSLVTGVIKDGNKVRGVFVENKSGAAAVRCKVVIDCTGTADVADRAGAPVIEMPTDPSMGVFFAIAGADDDRYKQALADRGEFSRDDQEWLERHCPGGGLYMPWVRQAWEAGEFRLVDRVDNFATLEIGMKDARGNPPLFRGRTRVNGNFQPGDGLALSRIQQKMYAYLNEFLRFLNHRVPGFENAYFVVVSPYFHSRGGKSIDSGQPIMREDLEECRRFDDVIYVYYDDKKFYPGGCDVPYRMLLPKEVDGLLAAGRSAVKRGPQLRQRYSMQLMGQAAGVAAALAAKNNVEPRDIDVRELQKALHALGSEVCSQERLKELGIV